MTIWQAQDGGFPGLQTRPTPQEKAFGERGKQKEEANLRHLGVSLFEGTQLSCSVTLKKKGTLFGEDHSFLGQPPTQWENGCHH